ncbi:6855_t:CDS:2 [Acaulospora colombiana]|uniref:6855_t:CDS:1 n=1 Tax=Acaulospora colombiana TaxID=27376 RepID=A0ACA9KV79_9GLOM|nr:6855_t:CDS:2 [Acaulospora colombiana]
MAPFLPADCLCQIFQNLTDQKSLYSCLLVNRLWCATSVEFLWSRPFHFLYTCHKTIFSTSLQRHLFSSSASTKSSIYTAKSSSAYNNRRASTTTNKSSSHTVFPSAEKICNCCEDTRLIRSSKLIETYLSCLSEKEKILLMENGIILPVEIQQSPLFDYAGFIRCLDLEEFYTAIKDWLEYANVLNGTSQSINMNYYNTLNALNGIGGRKGSLNRGNPAILSSSYPGGINAMTTGGFSWLDGETRQMMEFHNRQLKKKNSLKRFKLSNVVRFITKTINNHRRTSESSHDQSRRNSESSQHSTASSFDTIHTTSSSTPSSPTTIITSPNSPSYMTHPRERLVTEMLCRLLMRRCSTLRQLSIDRTNSTRPENANEFRCSSLRSHLSERFPNHRLIPEQYLMLPVYPGAISCLSSLSELICTTRQSKRKLFDLLADVSNQLTRISVTMDYSSNGGRPRKDDLESEDEARSLAALINFQQSLEQFELHGCEVGSSIIINSLRSQTNSLKVIAFNDIRFWGWESLDFLGECRNLEKLIFKSCNGLTNELLDSMMNVKYENLNTLIMENSPAPVHILESLIFGSHVESTDIFELHTLFTLCTNIQSFTLYGSRSPEINATDFFVRLSKQELPNLQSLSLHTAWSYTPSSLDQFLISSKPPLKYLEIRNSRCFNDEHLKVILKNLGKELNVLKLHVTNQLSEELVERAKQEIEMRDLLKREMELQKRELELRQRGFGIDDDFTRPHDSIMRRDSNAMRRDSNLLRRDSGVLRRESCGILRRDSRMRRATRYDDIEEGLVQVEYWESVIRDQEEFCCVRKPRFGK